MRNANPVRLMVAAAILICTAGALGANHTSSAPTTNRYTTVTPSRLYDTRPGQPIPANSGRDFQVTGGVVPSNATAVVVNITATESQGNGWLQVLPTGHAAIGSSSTLNLDFTGQTIPNASFAPIGNDGKITVYTTFTTDVLIDVFGYFVPADTATAGRLVPLTPQRILDTRNRIGWEPPPPNTAGPTQTRIRDGDVINLQVTNRGGVPASGVSAVVLNTTVVSPTAPGFVQVAPTPVNKGAHSNLNPEPHRTSANLVVVPVGAGGKVDLYTDLYVPGSVDLLADVVGYFTDASAPNGTAGLFVPIAPDRRLDTRQPPPRPERPSGSITDIDVSDIAPSASAIVGNLTSTGGGVDGYLQLAAKPVSPATASSLNTSYENQTIANAVLSPVGAGGLLQVYSFGSTHEVLDVTGWFTTVVSPTTTVPPTTTEPTTTEPTTTTTVAPTTTSPSVLPPLAAWEGGPAYWSAFSKAASVGWTNPSFFPIGVWLESAENASFLKSVGINTLVGVNHDGANLASIGQSTGMYFIAQADEWTASEIGATPYVVGHLASDEIDMFSSNPVPEQRSIVNELRARNDGRFVYSNYGKGSMGLWWNSSSLPTLTQMVDVASDDLYFWTDPNITDEIPQSPAWPAGAAVRDSASYGWTVDRMETFLSQTDLHPTWNFVELGHPFTESFAPTITPDQMEGAVWQSIVHGARGIVFFNHSFGGSCQTQHVLQDCGAAMRDRVNGVTARIRSLAPILNSQSYVWNGGTGVTTMLKRVSGSWYLVSSLAQKSAAGSKTLNVPVTSGTATVVGENRTVPIVNGHVVDSFASRNVMHVYQMS